jgi:hypothetical protein
MTINPPIKGATIKRATIKAMLMGSVTTDRTMEGTMNRPLKTWRPKVNGTRTLRMELKARSSSNHAKMHCGSHARRLRRSSLWTL